MGKRQPIANADLWIELDALLESRPHSSVVFTKVKAHATLADVQKGLITPFDRSGNIAADALAVAGACQLEGAGPERRALQLRATAAISVQRMMVDILHARRSASDMHRCTLETVSSGSEAVVADEQVQASDSGDGSMGTGDLSGSAAALDDSESGYEWEPD